MTDVQAQIQPKHLSTYNLSKVQQITNEQLQFTTHRPLVCTNILTINTTDKATKGQMEQ